MIFRDGIKPEWTDPNNQNGGRWLIEIDRKQRNEQLNDKWLETLLAVIGKFSNSSLRALSRDWGEFREMTIFKLISRIR